LNGQDGTAVLRGQVTDPSGAVITNASVVITPAAGSPVTTHTNAQGIYELKGLAPGKYTLSIIAPGFTTYENDNVVVTKDQARGLNVPLGIEVKAQNVQVSDTTPTVDVNPASNASAIVISGLELEALPDDPDELQSDLQALAGPSAGPNGGQMYIDGFTAGQLPTKSSIREIRINQNPFSSEYDKLGYGRIEIFTKPGTDKFHGQLYAEGTDSAFNSPDPFAGPEPSYGTTEYNGNIGGPLNKHASFFFNAEYRDRNDISAVNALDASGNTLSDAVPNPRQRTNLSSRLDYQLTRNNSLTARYQYFRNTETSDGVGGFALASQGYNSASTEHTLQINDTQVLGTKIINETRFQYLRDGDSQIAQTAAPAVNVQGAFTAGGNSIGSVADHQDHYELQNYTSMVRGTHIIKFGGRLRALREANNATSGFNGSFSYPSLAAFQTGTPNQFTITVPNGSPQVRFTNFDTGLYAQDDWRPRPNLTLSYGLRFEAQNDISDHGDWVPRLAIAYGIAGKNSAPKTVLRAGFGIFYERFGQDPQTGDSLILQALRLNGSNLQEFVVPNPDCSPVAVPLTQCIPAGSTNTATIYKIDPRLHAPYLLQAAFSFERQLTQNANMAVSYLNSRGFDQLITINKNAPEPGTYPANPVYPYGKVGNIYQYTSEGIFRQNQLIVNANVRAGSKVSLFGYYVLNDANSDTAGASTFPSNSYDIAADYGRAAFAVRSSVYMGGTMALPYAFRISPFLIARSGSPYNITVGQDLNGDSILNDRPGLISTITCASVQVNLNLYCTPLGTFDSNPNQPSAMGERIVPINYATGPSHITLNVKLSKTFGFGKKPGKSGGLSAPSDSGGGSSGRGSGGGGFGKVPGGGGFGRAGGGPLALPKTTDRRYSLTFSISARNVFNHVNLATPNGTLGSPLFGESNALLGGEYVGATAANRRIDLKASFNF
jgi:hypothetical protein